MGDTPSAGSGMLVAFALGAAASSLFGAFVILFALRAMGPQSRLTQWIIGGNGSVGPDRREKKEKRKITTSSARKESPKDTKDSKRAASPGMHTKEGGITAIIGSEGGKTGRDYATEAAVVPPQQPQRQPEELSSSGEARQARSSSRSRPQSPDVAVTSLSSSPPAADAVTPTSVTSTGLRRRRTGEGDQHQSGVTLASVDKSIPESGVNRTPQTVTSPSGHVVVLTPAELEDGSSTASAGSATSRDSSKIAKQDVDASMTASGASFVRASKHSKSRDALLHGSMSDLTLYPNGSKGRSSDATTSGKARADRKARSGPVHAVSPLSGSEAKISNGTRSAHKAHKRTVSEDRTSILSPDQQSVSDKLDTEQSHDKKVRRRRDSDASSSSAVETTASDSRRSERSSPGISAHPVTGASRDCLFLPRDQWLSGWFDLGRKTKTGTVKYSKRWFALRYRGWLLYWDSPEEIESKVRGFVQLHGCEVYEDLHIWERPKIVIQHPSKSIFHRHGPDPLLPPAQKSSFRGHKTSKRVRLLCVYADRSASKSISEESSYDEGTDRKRKHVVTLSEGERRRWLDALKREARSSPVQCEPLADVDTMYRMIDEIDSEEVYPGHRISDRDLPVTMPDEGRMILVRTSRSSPRDESLETMAEEESGAEEELVEMESPAAASRPSAQVAKPRLSRSRLRKSGGVRQSTELVRESGPSAHGADASELDLSELEEGVAGGQDPEKKDGLMKLLANAVGLDITTVAIPVTYNEPTSFLQRMCEVVQYYDLLNKADQCDDPVHAVVFVAAFALSFYHTNIRTTKPFNPLLGETFEYECKNDGSHYCQKPFSRNVPFRFIGEQVSHHPPIGASYCETKHFEFTQTQGLKTKFGGNNLACESLGSCEVKLIRSGKRYAWGGVKTVVHNIIIGSTWVDHYGEMEIIDVETGEPAARIELKKCGWFGKNRHEVRGWILDRKGSTRMSLEGLWHDKITAKATKGPALIIPGDRKSWPDPSDPTCVFKVHVDSELDSTNKWKLPPFAQLLCHLGDGDHAAPLDPSFFVDPALQREKTLLRHTWLQGAPMPSQPFAHAPRLPATDARLRPDRAALEIWDTKKAGADKRLLEGSQRSRKKDRESAGDVWSIRFFAARENNDDFLLYDFNHSYSEDKHTSPPPLW